MNRYQYLFILFGVFFTILVLYRFQFKKLIEIEVTNKQPTPEIFVPTTDWQRIKEDQMIPKGLHVRINLQTGEKEAKLLSAKESDENMEKSSLATFVGNENLDGLSYITYDLKNKNDVNHAKKIFRTYEQLKQEMSELNINIKTDAEVLDDLIKKFKMSYEANLDLSNAKSDQLISILRDFEYLLHQVDNAEEFAKRDGMTNIIVPCLSSNSSNIRTAAARVLGAAVQNNANVQIAALEAGVITPLLKNIALQKDYKIRSSSIYALSCLVRRFPLAEVKLIYEGGISVLLSLFEEDSDESFKLQMKVTTFFNDLMIEREDAREILQELLHNNVSDARNIEELQQIKEKLHQYDNIGLITKLVERGWCNKLSYLFINKAFRNTIIDENDKKSFENNVYHDTVDKILNSMLPVIDQCENHFKSKPKFHSILVSLLEYYKMLSLTDNDDDEFFRSLYDLLNKLITKLKIK